MRFCGVEPSDGPRQEVGAADEVGHEAVDRLLVQLGRSALLLDAAIAHHHDDVAHRQRLLLVVGHVHERDPDLALEGLELELHLLAQLQVERPERLVEQQHGRPVHQGASERDALLLAAGHLPRPAPLVADEADQGERLGDPPSLVDLVDLALAQAVADVARDVHVREQRVVLEDRVDVALVRRDPGDRRPGQQDLAFGRLLEAGDHPQRRGLATAGRPEQRVELAARDPQVHVVHGRDVAEPLRDADDLDIGGGLR